MAFKLPIVNTCCCGVRLELASKIIGWLTVISGILTFILSLTQLGNSASQSYEITMAISGVVNIIVGAVLLFGIMRSDASKIQIYVIVSTVLVILGLIAFVILTILFIVNGLIAQAITSFITICISSALTIYFIIVVNSYKLEIARGNIQNITP